MDKDTSTIDLADNKKIVFSKDFDDTLGHPVYNATVVDEVNPLVSIAANNVSDWVEQQKFTQALQQYGFTQDAVTSALEGLAKFHANFKADENTTFDFNVDAAHSSIGVGVKIKF